MTTPAEAPPDLPAAPPDDDLSIDPENRSYQRMSLRGPAIIVVGIATFILVGGVLASILTAGGNPVLSIHSVRIPDGALVPLTPATTALKPIISSEPPADILSALAVPAASVRRSWVNIDQNQTQYDRTASFTTGLSSDQVVALYKTLLPRLGWRLLYQGQGSANGISGTEILARRGSGDGYYWEVGAIVPPTTASGTTPFTLVVLEQNSDQ